MGQSYKDLIAWQRAMDFVAAVYSATKHFPKDELYCLTSQLLRAALSIPSNIAEGQGRLTAGEFRQFLGHARGSLLEAETQIEVARKLNYLTANEADNLLRTSAEVGRVLNGLLASI
ncbi:MAG TPA: four helix bundle protein [Terriglobales bacterium]|nr:four helix bundle protein [Terriglobales bacterium]